MNDIDDKYARLAELIDRLVAPGPKAAHVSASETHEIQIDAHELIAEARNLAAVNTALRQLLAEARTRLEDDGEDADADPSTLFNRIRAALDAAQDGGAVGKKTPLEPNVYVRAMPSFSVCNCCGVEDGTIKQIVLGWRERDGVRHGGASSVSLCASCRKLAADALRDEVTRV